MDAQTVRVYATHAARWAAARGTGPDDGLATGLRARAGSGLIVDAGCGPGRYLAQLGTPVVGLDATFAMLGLARHRGAALVCGDLEDLPFGGASVAGIFARHSYLHVPKERFARAVAEAGRILVPGGVLLLTVIAGDYEGHTMADDDFPGRWYSLWQSEELAGALHAAGLSDVDVAEVPARWGTDLVATGMRP